MVEAVREIRSKMDPEFYDLEKHLSQQKQVQDNVKVDMNLNNNNENNINNNNSSSSSEYGKEMERKQGESVK